MTRTLLALAFAGCALAQTPQPLTVARLYDNQLRGAERSIVSLAEKMPADKFDFKPTNGEFKNVRTFAEQIKHVAAVLYMVAAAAKDEPVPNAAGAGESGPAALKSKDEIVKYLKDAFAYAHGSMALARPDNLVQMVKSPFGNGQTSRGALWSEATWHTYDHYGQLVVYVRMNGIVPAGSQ